MNIIDTKIDFKGIIDLFCSSYSSNKVLKAKILYFYPNDASFVRKDIEIMETEFEIIQFCVKSNKKWTYPLKLIQQILLCIYHFKAKHIVCQFAGFHSYFPIMLGKMFGINSVIVLGGSDCASFPEINYGCYRKKLLAWFTRKSIENANVLSPVHEKMIEYDYSYDKLIHKKQGFKAFTNPKNALIKVIYNGFRDDFFKDLQVQRKKNFVCIAGYNRKDIYQLKGIDLLEKAAIKFPEINFTIIGVANAFMNQERPKNLIFIPFVNQEELRAILNEHYFYCQLSMSEGFPNALCEAMLCACIPIVSNVSSMPDIIQKQGFVLHQRDEHEFFTIIEKALNTENLTEMSMNARNRVVNNYLFDRRKNELLELLRSTQK